MSRVIVWLENREKTIDGRMLLTVFETEKSFKSKSLEKKKNIELFGSDVKNERIYKFKSIAHLVGV